MAIPPAPAQSFASVSESLFESSQHGQKNQLRNLFGEKVGNFALAFNDHRHHSRRTAYHRLESSSFMENDAQSDETSETLEMSETAREFVIPESGNLTEVNYINPHTVEMQQNDIKHYLDASLAFARLIKVYFPEKGVKDLDKEEFDKLQQSGNELISSVKQLLLDTDTQKKGKEIPFFAERSNNLPKTAAEKICKYLNEIIVLNLKRPLKDKKVKNLISSKYFEQRTELDKDYKFLYLMLIYNEALRFLCAKLKNDQPVLKLCKPFANEKTIDEIINSIREILRENSESPKNYLPFIAEEISVRYIEKSFKPELLEKVASQYIQYLETAKGKKYSYEGIVKGFDTAFNEESNINPAVEFERAIKGGILEWVDIDENELIPPLDPLNLPKDPKEVEGLVNEYTVKCQEVVGEQLFDDKEVVKNFSMFLYEFANFKSPAKNKETPLETHARIFNLLYSFDYDKVTQKEFQSFMNNKLRGTNSECMDGLEKDKLDSLDISYYLKLFYRAPFQTYIIEPTAILLDIYTMIFSKIDNTSIIENLSDWKDNETKKIKIWFDKHHLKFQFLRRGSIGKPSEAPSGIIIQDLKILVPLPGGSKIADPVTLQFYCEEEEEEISESEKAELHLNLERIAFVLKLLKFPNLQKLITK